MGLRRTRPGRGVVGRALAGACAGLLCAALATGASASEQVPRSQAQIALSFAPVVRAAAPAMVNIYTRNALPRSPLNPFEADPLFRFFFEEFGQHEAPRESENSLGSGVIVGADGLIVTNYHVVGDADEIMVVLHDRREFRARVVGADDPADLALLDIDSDGLPALPLGDSDALEVGDLVLAIGNPFGIGQTVTSGIISALARSAPQVDSDLSFIQIDAAINPGNSGGALVTVDGLLVGINTAIFTRGGGSTGIGFAIPVNLVKALIRSVESGNNRLARAWLGAAVQSVDSELAAKLGLSPPVGVLLNRVHPEGPAARAGLVLGDVILAIDRHEIQDPKDLNFRLAIGVLGDEAKLDVWRRGHRISLRLPLETPPYHPEPEPTTLHGYQPLGGATVANLSPGLNKELNNDLFKRGVVVLKIEPGSPVWRLHLQRGDLVVAVNDQTIESVDQLTASLLHARPPWRLEIERDGHTLAMVM